MAQSVSGWFNSSGFMPHGHCYLWTPTLLNEYIISDTIIGLSYYTIPIALLYFGNRRKDFGLNRILILFSAFIFACGTTHFLSVWTIWHPDYWLDAALKIVTAAISVTTAILLWPLMPRAVKLPSPAQLQSVVLKLEREMSDRGLAQGALAKLNETLEARVAERTAELTAANQRLQAEIGIKQRTTEALRISEARFRSLVVATSEIIWRTDAAGNTLERTLIDDNSGLDFIFDKARARWSHPVHPDDQARNIERWTAGIADTVPFGQEFRLLRDDGSCSYMEYRAIPILEDGSVREWLGITRDISERHTARNKILSLNTHIRELVLVVQSIASTRDLQSIIVAVKTAARRLAGADGAALILLEGDSTYCIDEDAIGPLWKGQRFKIEDCVGGWSMINRSPAVIEDVYLDDRVPHDCFRPTFVKSMAMVPIRTADPIGAIGVYWAATHKLGDDELQLLTMLADAAAIAIENVRHYETLESRVDQRTTQLLAANQELETFTYSVSHDLKAPLRGIDGYSRLLLEDYASTMDAEPRQFLENIRSGAQQMGELIEDLLSYSRMERRTLQIGPQGVRSLVDAIVARFATEIASLGVEIRISVPDDEIRADANALNMALRNLLDNALKFSRRDAQAWIEIGAKSEGTTYLIWVRDNGIGFDMQFSSKVFDIFQRLNRVEDYPGTGIGLAIVRKAMQRMDGSVRAQSKLGEGSTFFLELPQ